MPQPKRILTESLKGEDRFSVRHPYPDDPRWTPWDRFIERTLGRVDELAQLVEGDLDE